MILYLELQPVFPETDCHGIIIGFVGSHADTEAGIPALAALHHHDLYLLVHALIIYILIAAVGQINFFLVMLRVDIAGPHEYKQLLGTGLAFNEFILCEIEQRLGNGT